MPIAGHKTAVKLGGTPVAFTNEPMSEVTGPGIAARTVYRIVTAIRQVLDPNTAVVVEVDADGAGAGGYAVSAAGSYSLNTLFGKVTFATPLAVGALVRISASYIPTLTVAEAHQLALNAKRALLDRSKFGTDHMLRLAGLKEASINLSVWDVLTADQDPGAGTLTFAALLDGGTAVLVEVDWDGDGANPYFRGWFLLESEGQESANDSQVVGTVTGQSTLIPHTGRSDGASVAFDH